ncbi:hypothetical protein GQ44DRAFT_574699, partial [Phaeosphaeriaceae sp. PMI808]
MRLLKRNNDDSGYSLTEFMGNDIPDYAILSHTWGADHEEVTLKDLYEGTFSKRKGYKKVQFCNDKAVEDGLDYFWVDTCCIDKTSSAELTEAINSMFTWYRNASRCYVYLSDVSSYTVDDDASKWKPAFRNSRWFTRGWTLQELIAPNSVEFFSQEGHRLGDKESMIDELHKITKINITALQGCPLEQLDVEERMSWIQLRGTKRAEDMAYSLLGIFDVQIPLIYGEGQRKAFIRLRREI